MNAKADRTVPAFSSESAESDWWHKNRGSLDADFRKAADRGELKKLDRSALRARVAGSSRIVSIRIPDSDLALAREQAAKAGLPYQTYIKSLLHQALVREEQA